LNLINAPMASSARFVRIMVAGTIMPQSDICLNIRRRPC
jgi:hypothetical protein